MAFGKVLYSGLLTTTNPTQLFVATGNGTVTITHGTVCNNSGSAVTVSVAVLKNGDSLDGTHYAISGYSLAAGDTLSLRDYLVGALLGHGDAIWATAGVANALSVILSGSSS